MALGKRTVAARKNVDPTKVYKVTDAVKIVKGNAKAKFDETIEIAVNLGIDPKQGGLGITAGWDSLKQIEIILAVEKEFGFRFQAAEIGSIKLFSDLSGKIEERTAG